MASMSLDYSSTRISTFGLLPEPERSPKALFTAALVNGTIVGALFLIGATATHVLQRRAEVVELVAPDAPPPPKIKPVTLPKLPPPPAPVLPKVQLETPKIQNPVAPKPEPKPIQMEAKVDLPVIKPKDQQVVLAPQPKAALAAATPAELQQMKPSTAAVHLGEMTQNTMKTAQVAAIGNAFGGAQGQAVTPRGVVGSAGIGNSVNSGSSAGVAGKVASAGIPSANTATQSSYGKVAAAGIPTVVTAGPIQQTIAQVADTSIEVMSKPAVQYTAEARELKIQGDVVLSVTFLASGQVRVESVVRGLGHGLDEEARRVAQQIRFHPATHGGHAVDLTTKITISFQLAQG